MVFIQPVPIRSARDHVRFLANRFTRIYPPYWLITLPLALLWLKWPHLFNNYYHNQVDLLRSFLLWPQNYTPLLGVGWSLIHEIYFYLAVACVLHLGRTGRWWAGGFWLAAVLTVSFFFGAGGYGGSRVLQLVFSPFSATFLLGYFLGLSLARLQKLDFRWGLVLVAVGGGVAFYSAGHFPFSGIYPDNNHLQRWLLIGVPCGLLVMGALILERHLPPLILRLQYFGDRSYALYLIHPVLVTVFYLLAAHVARGVVWLAPVLAVLCFLLCLLAAALFHERLELSVTRWARKQLTRWGLG